MRFMNLVCTLLLDLSYELVLSTNCLYAITLPPVNNNAQWLPSKDYILDILT